MSNKTPLLPVRRPGADVISLSQRRAARFDAAQTPELQARYAPLTEAAEAAARATVRKQPPVMKYVEVAISNNDLIFQALHGGLMRAQRAKHITSFGATLSNSETQGDGGFWERPAGLSFPGVEYAVTLLSNGWPSNIKVPDGEFPQRMKDECIMLLEGEGGSKFYVYADRVQDVPQINNARYWKVYTNIGGGDVVSWTFRNFLRQHHPDLRTVSADIAQTGDVTLQTELRGYSVGDHKAASAKGGHVMVIGGTDEEDDEEITPHEEQPKRKKRQRRPVDPNHIYLGVNVARKAAAKRKGPAKITAKKKKPGVRLNNKIKKTVSRKQQVKKAAPKATAKPQRSVTRRARRLPRPDDNM